MNTLSLRAINSLAPYEVALLPNGSLSFDTDFGITYNVGFDEDISIWDKDAYQFFIANINQRNSPNDPKLRQTVMAIIEEFFRCNPSILLYLCETGDDKQAARNRLFERWFNDGNYKQKYYFQNVHVEAENVINYAAIIVQRNNPELDKIIAEFNYFVSAMSGKPEAR